MTRNRHADPADLEQVEKLFIALSGPDATADDWDRYQRLLQRSPEVRELHGRYGAIWHGLDNVGRAALQTERSTAASAGNEYAAVATAADRFRRRRAPPPAGAVPRSGRRKRQWRRAAAAALLGLVVIAGFGLRQHVRTGGPGLEVTDYVTQIGEHRQFDLPDGSSLMLGGRSAVRVRYDSGLRFVELRSGEVLASVAHDAARPFLLATDDMTVMATGTAFNVRNSSEYSTVSVVEGAVSVVAQVSGKPGRPYRGREVTDARGAFAAGTPLGPGQQLRAAKKAGLGAVRDVDIESVVSWQSGQLYFLDDDLATVFGEVMRYSDVTFEFSESGIGARSYTGSFRPDSLNAWLAGMERAYSLQITRIGDNRIGVAPRSDPSF